MQMVIGMAKEINVGGTHTRDEIAEHLEQLANDLRRGEPVKIFAEEERGEEEELRLDPPQNPDFEFDVDRDTSWTGDTKSTDVTMNLSWDEEETKDEEELTIR